MYIDIEDEEKNEDGKVYSKWSELPDLLLEKIFSYLSIREKYYCSLVCQSWHRAFYLPYVWSQFVLEDTTLTRGKFNYYSGWQVSFELRLFLLTWNVPNCKICSGIPWSLLKRLAIWARDFIERWHRTTCNGHYICMGKWAVIVLICLICMVQAFFPWIFLICELLFKSLNTENKTHGTWV